MSVALDFKLTEFLDNPFNCICGEESLVMGYVHDEGDDHPQCEDCVRQWTAAKDSPTCAICRKAVNAASVLSSQEVVKGALKREQDRAAESQCQYGEDERVAIELAANEAGPLDRVIAPFIGNDQVSVHPLGGG